MIALPGDKHIPTPANLPHGRVLPCEVSLVKTGSKSIRVQPLFQFLCCVEELERSGLLPKNRRPDYTRPSSQTVATDRIPLRGRIMRLALVFIFTLLIGCAEPRLDHGMDPGSRTDTAFNPMGNVRTEGRKALYDQAREGLRQSRERYIATTRPVLERKFRYEHPDLTETEIEAMINEALATGYRHEAEPRPEGPVRLPPQRPMNCIPSPGGWPSNPNCY